MFGNTRPRRRCHQHSEQPKPFSPPAWGPDEPYVNHEYTSGWTNQPPQSFDIPMTPPPPYDIVVDLPAAEPPTQWHEQPVQPRSYGLTPREKKLRKKVSALASCVDLTRPVQVLPFVQEQEWQSNMSSVTAQEQDRSGRPKVNTMLQGAALCDRAVAAVHEAYCEALSRLDHEDERHEDPVETTRALSLEQHPLEKMRAGTSVIDFKKTWMYANSRLPPYMIPVRIYLPTWQLICSAAQSSLDVYQRPRKDAKRDYVAADWRQGTKAMIVNSKPVDDKNLIVIAIRGSKWNIVDWAVNFSLAPTEPIGFLDDEGNACHAGFLQVARAMISPIAARLRNLLEQDPSRASSSLLFTGHSAGGAVASLLYMHMIASTVESDLNILMGCFKRVHCITFGTPPLTLLPLQNPPGRRFEKNVFMSFVNEGDLVVRADMSYLRTLACLVAAPSPLSNARDSQGLKQRLVPNRNTPPRWSVPPAALSNAGRMVLLRQKPGKQTAGTVEAVGLNDEELRGVIFGDTAMHEIELYSRRVHDLAFAAISGRGG